MSYAIQRYKTPLTIDTAEDADEIVSGDIGLNGILRGVIVTAPDLDDTDTFTVALKDVDGRTIFSKGTLAESATHAVFDQVGSDTSTLLPLERPLSGNHTITITASGDQAADRTFTVVLLIERR